MSHISHLSPSNHAKVLITGATGFIGGALAARLIHTEHWADLLFLVRAPHKEDGLMRLAHNLRLHGIDDPLIDRLHLDQILCGDLMRVRDWINDPRLHTIERVVNSAAIASFGKHPSIFPTNLNGVLEMAQGLAARAPLQRFLQISTGMACAMDPPHPVHESYCPDADAVHFLDYTQSKFEAEQALKTQLPQLPLVIARPSIVVGHTQLGCAASGSIYWVFRLARALQAFPCTLDQKIDVIPVDYCAQAIACLLFKDTLQHSHYNISASESASCSFAQIDAAIAAALRQKPMRHYQQKDYGEFLAMQNEFKTHIGPCNKRIVLKAIRSYGYFASQEILFRNANLLEEGLPTPTPFADYAGLCEITSQQTLIADQMRADYK